MLTFLRAANRAAFERTDTAYAETVAARVAGAVDLARATAGSGRAGFAGRAGRLERRWGTDQWR